LGGYEADASLSCAVIAQQDEDMQRDYWYSSVRDWREIEGRARLDGKRRNVPWSVSDARQVGNVYGAGVLFVPELARA